MQWSGMQTLLGIVGRTGAPAQLRRLANVRVMSCILYSEHIRKYMVCPFPYTLGGGYKQLLSLLSSQRD